MESAHQSEPSSDLLSYVDSLRLGREVVNLMLRGRSVIDSNVGLPLGSPDAADEFLLKYGYNLENPVENAEVYGNFHEALRFIRKYFLKPENPDGADLEIPRRFMELTDMRQLFTWASDKSLEHTNRARWACGTLRVMHAISHLDKDLRHDYFSEIQKQIFDRFYKEIHSEGDNLFLGDPKNSDSVRLDKFHTKPRKSRDSVILKILHKKETLAEDVFDQIGLRFITHSRIDVVRVLKYLRDRYIVMAMNLRPSRSRNNLVDPLLYRRSWREVKHQVMRGELTDAHSVEQMLEGSLRGGYRLGQKEIGESNPISLESYQSIQFTCRQLIKYRNPAYEDVKNLRTHLQQNSSDEEVHRLLDRLDLAQLAKEQRFFYPYEVQIMDKQNFEEAESGQASHAVYKAAQVKKAMKRVLKQLLPEGV
ncbi:MAG: TIGR04552 family protein [Proteobacteria bacterium]|nr:MAG: TIGR04552 family protein [Pseudomonadota bacterium]